VITPDHGGSHAGGPIASGTSSTGNLGLRVASAVVLAPVVLVITYVGGWPFSALCAAAAAGILWEWMHLVTGKVVPGTLGPGLGALLAAFVLAGLNHPFGAAIAIALGALLAGTVGGAQSHREARAGVSAWAAGGMVYAGVAFISPVLLRRDPSLGLTALLFVLATVWSTDILAFFGGKAVGGPLLWPSVSPKKTWAGVLAGLAGGVAGGAAVAYASGIDKLGTAGIMALLLSVLAQAGDLLESAVKRHFGAKDASGLIPGHGGLMDRLDGFVAAAFAALVIGMLRRGMDAPALGLLVW